MTYTGFEKWLESKGPLISKAIYGLLTSPKKRRDEFVLFAFLLFTANKSNSSIRFLGESTAHQTSFRFYLTFSRYILNNFSIHHLQKDQCLDLHHGGRLLYEVVHHSAQWCILCILVRLVPLNSYNKLREQKKMYPENKNVHKIRNAPSRNNWWKDISMQFIPIKYASKNSPSS